MSSFALSKLIFKIAALLTCNVREGIKYTFTLGNTTLFIDLKDILKKRKENSYQNWNNSCVASHNYKTWKIFYLNDLFNFSYWKAMISWRSNWFLFNQPLWGDLILTIPPKKYLGCVPRSVKCVITYINANTKKKEIKAYIR